MWSSYGLPLTTWIFQELQFHSTSHTCASWQLPSVCYLWSADEWLIWATLVLPNTQTFTVESILTVTQPGSITWMLKNEGGCRKWRTLHNTDLPIIEGIHRKHWFQMAVNPSKTTPLWSRSHITATIGKKIQELENHDLQVKEQLIPITFQAAWALLHNPNHNPTTAMIFYERCVKCFGLHYFGLVT